MKITMLGTGNAVVTECYNTCFVLSENNNYFLVDGGGGSTLLRQLKHAGIPWTQIKDILVRNYLDAAYDMSESESWQLYGRS